MANRFPPVRSESRIPKEVVIELQSFENAGHEIASTIDLSPHGARVLTNDPWAPHQHVFVRFFCGALHSRAHVVYCRPLPHHSYSVGLEFLQPPWEWLAFHEPSLPPRPN
jgi:hypothetical protein